MRWIDRSWFKNLCMAIVIIFSYQSVQPMEFGFSLTRQVTTVPPPKQVFPAEFLNDRLKSQINHILDKVKGQLQHVEMLPDVESPTKKLAGDTTNCAVSEDNTLAGAAIASTNSLASFNVDQGRAVLEMGKADLDSHAQGVRGEINSESRVQWLDLLSSIFVSEAYAQIPDQNLDSTPDANTTDPFIVQKAQELGNDADQIFAFVRDEIGYESYRGSLRGARGTLWSNAGNALDQASLLIALLRASEIPARYVEGTLSDAISQQLILSMFPNPTRVVGCPPDDVERANPANDPQLLAETREHYWVELDTGGGFTSADPTVSNAQLGNSFAVSEGTFSEVPDAFRHKVALRLNVEFNNSLTSGLQDQSTVLNETFNTVELVGHPLSVGHFVNTKTVGGAVFTMTTHTYSPYILIGQNDADISDDEFIRGQDYQELFSNLAFSTTFLTGVFLEMDVIEPEDENGQRWVENYQRDLSDRIGFAARQTGGASNIGVNTNGDPSFSEFNVVTINALPGLQSDLVFPIQQERLTSLTQKLSEIQPLLNALPESGELTTEEQALMGRAFILLRNILIVTGETLTLTHAAASDVMLNQLEQGFMTKAHYVSPRLILALTLVEGGTGSIKLDLRKNDIRVMPVPGQVSKIKDVGIVENQSNDEFATGFIFEVVRGIIESALEGEVLSAVTGKNSTSIFDIFNSLDGSQDFAVIVNDNLQELESLPISDVAKARIAQAVRNGKGVISPRKMVTIEGKADISWFETDLVTGHTVSVMMDGGHQAALEFGFLIPSKQNQGIFLGIGILGGFATEIVNFQAAFMVQLLDGGTPLINTSLLVINAKTAADIITTKIIIALLAEAAKGVSVLAGAFAVGMGIGANVASDWLKRNFPEDPPVFPFLSKDLISPSPFASGTSGVALQLVSDDLFTLPVGGAEVPSVFRAQIQNLGPDEDTFALSFSQVPSGFTIQSSVPTLTVPAGETGEIGICVVPDGPLGNAGDPATFTADVVSTTNGTVTATDTEPFTIPSVPGVTLSGSPAALSSAPGLPVSSTLTISSVGNVSLQDVPLILEFSPELTVTGLTSPITLGSGQSTTQTLTLTPGASVPLNSTLIATVTATLPVAPFTVSAPISLQIAAPGAQPAVDASIAAGQLGQAELASTLDTLGTVLTELFNDLTNQLYKSRVLATLDTLLGQLDDPLLTPFLGDLAAAKDALANSTPATIGDALNQLSGVLGSIEGILSGLVARGVDVFLFPPSRVALPDTPAIFDVSLQNTGTQTTTYLLSLSPLPGDVIGSLDQTSITLVPGEAVGVDGVPGPTVTLTQTGQSLQAFGFSVTATVQSQPEITQSAHGTMTAREELVTVVEVKPDPGFVNAGENVQVSTRLLNAVNQPRAVEVSYVVKDPTDAVVFTSSTVETILTVSSSLDTIDLGSLDTTGFVDGTHSLEVTVADVADQSLPNVMGQSSLLIGSPLNATLSITPEILPPGDGTVTATLNVESLVPLPGPQINLLGLVDTPASATTVEFKDNLAYVCGTEDIAIVDINDPTSPQILSNFAGNLIAGAFNTQCRILNNHLIVFWQIGLNANGLPLLVYDLADPLNPNLIRNTSLSRRFINSMFIKGDAAYLSTLTLFFIGSISTQQRGDFFSVDFSNITNPQFRDALLAPTSNPDGGNFNMFQTFPITDSLAYVASTTATGGAGGSGVGRLYVANIANPSNLFTVRTLSLPGTVYATGVGAQGTIGLAVGTTGPRAQFRPSNLTGNLKLFSLDVSDPANPQILGELVTNVSAPANTRVTPLGNGFFSIGGSNIGGTQVLVVVDTNDPQNLQFSTINVPGFVHEARVIENRLHTVSSAGLGIYDIGNVVGTRVTSEVRVPNNIGVALVPNTFNIDPTEIIAGTDFDTFVWERSLNNARPSETFTWDLSVTGLQAGEARAAIQGATIDFMVADEGAGQIELPSQFVVSEQLLGLTPGIQTVQPGALAGFTVTVNNPTDAPVTHNLSVQGVPSQWVTIASSVTVLAQDSVQVPLALRSETGSPVSENGFVVSIDDPVTSVSRSTVQGTLNLAGSPLLPSSDTLAVIMDLNPPTASGGQGNSTTYVARVTNTGNVTDTYTLTGNFPAGFTGVFAQASVEVPAGLTNFREVLVTLSPPVGTAPGDFPFTVTATSTANGSVQDGANGTLSVVNLGVAVSLSPTTGAPVTPFEITVTNTGTVAETFDLGLGGELGAFSLIPVSDVTLNAGESLVVPITVDPGFILFPGDVTLAAVATSQTTPAVQGAATATVTIAPTQGVTAVADPTEQILPVPGAAGFTVIVENEGNTEDAFTAEITAITGPLTGDLTGLDSQPTQQIETFRLPGHSTGALTLDTNISQIGEGTVDVTITSQSASAVTDTATARVEVPNTPPVANAGPDQSLALGETGVLDGSASSDPDNFPSPLAFQWSLVSVPAGSSLTNADLMNATQSVASLTPDIFGDYVVRLTVSDGQDSTADEAVVRAENHVPIADAGVDQHVETGVTVNLDGSGSFDADGELITYVWTLQTVPATSVLTSADLIGATTPNPSIIPDVDGSYTLQLIVHDGLASSDPDEVVLLASLSNVLPNADAGMSQDTLVGSTVSLNGTKSQDPDNGPSALTFQWNFVQVPVGSTLQDANIINATQNTANFVPDVAGLYELNLTVSDGAATDQAQVFVTAFGADAPPNANAGEDQSVPLGTEVSVNGSGSNDPDNGPSALTYNWAFVSVPALSSASNATILDAQTATPRLTPDVAGAYVLRLTVSDGLFTDADNVMVVIRSGPRLGDFILLGQEGVWLKQNSIVVNGDVGANIASPGPFLASGVETTVGIGVEFLSLASKIMGDSVKVKQNAQVYDVHTNEISGNGDILGQVITPLALPIVPAFPPIPSITPGTQDFDIPQHGTLTLNAGHYGLLKVRKGSTINLTGGEYHFAEWDVGTDVTMNIEAPVDIRIEGKLMVDQNSTLLPSPAATNLTASDIVITVTGINGNTGNVGATTKAAKFGLGTTLRANVYVPNGTLWLRQNSTNTGAFIAKWMILGISATATFEGGFE
jgi:large repetitive protein